MTMMVITFLREEGLGPSPGERHSDASRKMSTLQSPKRSGVRARWEPV